MATKTEAAKWLVYYAASLKDTGKPYTKEAAMAKLNASENARFVTNLALQIHGGYGYMQIIRWSGCTGMPRLQKYTRVLPRSIRWLYPEQCWANRRDIMKIAVCVKQVPDTNEVKINQETGTLIREGVPSIINPDDKNAWKQPGTKGRRGSPCNRP